MRRNAKKKGEVIGSTDNQENEEPTPANQENINEDCDEEDLLNMKIPAPPESFMHRDGNRMVISHIEVENFKSYHGRQIIGPFHKSFTSIIGPNGSGKSNVIDSLLFVFGYRASKIRSKKISVLIHSSAGRENIQNCTVTIHFCKIVDVNESEYKKVDGSNIAVARTAFKDNSSRYSLNGKTVKFKEIGDLLRINGVDLVHNRFLILQGEVEQISMMKPKAEKEDDEGMLEYLEDIIGSSRLKQPINKLSRRIGRIDERRDIQLQRLQHAEKDKQKLTGPAREILLQMRLENAVNCLTNRILLAKKYTIEEQLSQLEGVKGQRTTELAENHQKHKELTNQAKQHSAQRQRLQCQLDKVQDEVQSIERKIGESKQAKVKATNDKKRLATRKNQLEENTELEREKLTEWMSAPEKAKTKIEEYRKQLLEANAVIDECSPLLIQKLDEAQQLVRNERHEKTELEAKLSKISVVEDDLNSKLLLAQEKKLNLRREEEAQRSKYDELHNKLLDTENKYAQVNRDLHSTVEALPELEQTFEGKKVRIGNLREREAKLANLARDLRSQYEERRQAEEQWKGDNKMLERLMQAKQSGEIGGIFGRLGDLGAIDQKYDVAISTTCYALDHIVVDDVPTAQQCIDLLKRHKLGVASFIALNKQSHFWNSIRQRPNTPENAPRLFDLIRVADEKILPAFYFAVQDTLVADDIVAATRIGINSGGRRWRTVTLKGEIVDVSGSMTGGGNQQIRGKIGQNVRVDTREKTTDEQQSIGELQQQMNNAEAELAAIRRECELLETELQQRQGQLNKMQKNLREFELDKDHLGNTVKKLREQIETQKKKVIEATADPVEVRNVETEIENINTESAQIAEKTNKLRMEIMELNERMEEVTKRIAGPCQKRIKEAEKIKNDAEAGINTENVKLASTERNLKKINEKLRNLEQDIKEAERQLETVSTHFSEAVEQLEKLDENLNQRKNEVEAARAILTEFIESISERNEEEMALQKKVDELKRALKGIENEVATLGAKLKAGDAKLSSLKCFRTKWLVNALSKETSAIVGRLSKKQPVAADDEEADEYDEVEGEDSDEERGGGDALDDEMEVEDGTMGNGQRQPGDGDDEEITDDLELFLHDCAAIDDSDVNFEETDGEVDDQMEIDDSDEGEEEDDLRNDNHSNRGTTNHPRPRAIANPDSLNKLFMPLPKLSEQVVRDEVDVNLLESHLAELEKRKRKHSVANLTVVLDFMAKLKKYQAEFKELAAITEQRDLHRSLHDRLKKQRLHEFMEGFQQIATELRVTYQMITIQGDVSLELVDSLDPFAEGIAFNVRPPKKSWKQITNLSGGEKTLASLSLVFGLHKYKPTPLYVMDEIDAALDFRNVSIIANYLLERTRNAQFIVISLRNQMYEKANRLIGIYKVNDCTRNVVVDPQEMFDGIIRSHYMVNITVFFNAIQNLTGDASCKELAQFCRRWLDDNAEKINANEAERMLAMINLQTHTLGGLCLLYVKLTKTRTDAELRDFLIYWALDIYNRLFETITEMLLKRKAPLAIPIALQICTRPSSVFRADAATNAVSVEPGADGCGTTVGCTGSVSDGVDKVSSSEKQQQQQVQTSSSGSGIASSAVSLFQKAMNMAGGGVGLSVKFDQPKSAQPLLKRRAVLLYFYYGALIYAALEQWEEAALFLEHAICFPAMKKNSAIALDAVKKYNIIWLILGRSKPIDSLPHYRLSSLQRNFVALASVYTKLWPLVQRNADNKTDLVRALFSYLSEKFVVFEKDKNVGLMKVLANACRENAIKRLGNIFVSLQLEDVNRMAHLSQPTANNEEEESAEQLILRLRHKLPHFVARIDGRTQTVIFEEETKGSKKEVAAQLQHRVDSAMADVIRLASIVHNYEDAVRLNPNYVEKCAAQKEKARGTGGNGGGSSSSMNFDDEGLFVGGSP
uniref:Structural maintenance of chromosomes protein 4 n=1 Tax=Globodera rostochiensis TaxID=31243 RepID=A0A914I5F6_GLORO